MRAEAGDVTGENPGGAGLRDPAAQDAEPALVPGRSCGTCKARAKRRLHVAAGELTIARRTMKMSVVREDVRELLVDFHLAFRGVAMGTADLL